MLASANRLVGDNGYGSPIDLLITVQTRMSDEKKLTICSRGNRLERS